ncbi:hypothetical protein AN9052.2 [Aspergillus nidulans FGSC A4]|uniref:Uncharacterized protein n=1 Tax=Emericella nidulans (strain FGSC A4 / ATCC 38163 / CBS 112.46 / NRRL 194 / M139) TaxID=227321 RepID=Q5ARM8_EMENI|nr:hypothetical protein [Aspergillus nidulans FGSC A4]EAA64384.1 hypothetical protein AN9052.2 [Aspergillus nidulans FGSC A4]CBF84386.1 TPA: conserved hypothetical protein [Aspergillus nidulans FGSC A4]|eukprot:XP_682321.1 hypothetical protein AN9052.2 [Aspergillus nidulans FGSC A4]
MRTIYITALIAFLALEAFGYPTDTDAVTEPAFPGYEDGTTTFQVVPYPDADKITLSGTMQEVHAKILEINPIYEEDWKNVNNTYSKPEPRSDKPPLLNCDGRNGYAKIDKINDGISYLRKFKLPPGLEGNTCQMVSCSYDSAISWCNALPTLRVLPSFDNIADGAQVILNWCQVDWDNVGGVLGHPDSWRVFVDKEKC